MVQTVLISGGTSGIGLATAKILAGEGLRPVLLGRNEERGQKAQEQVRGSLYVPCDVTVTKDCQKAVKAASAIGKSRALSFPPVSMKKNCWKIPPMRKSSIFLLSMSSAP